MKILALFILVFIVGNSIAQIDASNKCVLQHKINLRSIQPTDQLYVKVKNLEMPTPSGNSMKSELIRRKAELQAKFPRKKINRVQEKAIAPDPIIQNGYEGSAAGNSVPCDNTIAISNSGIVMSARNSNYMIYDSNTGTVLKVGPLKDFINNTPLSDFDPKVIYDPIEDRFVLIFLLGNSTPSTYIVTSFSETSDPLGVWNTYFVPGDALSTGHWSDYPAISISEEELFITINLLVPGGSWQTSFHQTVIWQIDKSTGYNGDATLTSQIWDGIQEGGMNLRNLHPVKGGAWPTGPNQYFVSNRNFASESDSIYLVEVTNTMASGTAAMNVSLINSSDNYYLSPSGRQSIPDSLATNDSRVLGAIYANDNIHFIQNCMDTATGNSAIYHGIIEAPGSGSPTVSGNVLSSTTKDFGYPNITHLGSNPTDEKYVISFEFSSPVDSAGTACFYYEEGDYSNFNLIKEGEGTLNILTGTSERWGDYTGLLQKYNEPCAAWSVGTFAKSNNTYGAWITEIRSTASDCMNAVGINEPHSEINVGLFPNPVLDQLTIDFILEDSESITVSVFDLRGKLVKTVYKDETKKGNNRLTLATNIFNPGHYILSIGTSSGNLKSMPFVKE